MNTVTSRDGTSIAFERCGSGPALVLVDPAGGYRGFDNIRGLGALLAERFTVYTYDRRGRGESTDTLPYAVEREIEDLAALIDQAGGHAFVYAFSSGGLLALQAAAAGLDIDKLVLMEPPIGTDDERTDDDAFTVEIAELVAGGRCHDAGTRFLAGIGVPLDVIAQMEPLRPAFDAVAHTLVYDCMIAQATGVTVLSSVSTPTLILDSEGSTDAITGMAANAAQALPNATHRSLPGQWHGLPDTDLAPVVAEYLTGG